MRTISDTGMVAPGVPALTYGLRGILALEVRLHGAETDLHSGIYGGAVGHIGFDNDMDLAIAIRTAVIKDQQLYVQAGAGIVADSDPDSEWQETQNKMRAVLQAATLACAGLDTTISHNSKDAS